MSEKIEGSGFVSSNSENISDGTVMMVWKLLLQYTATAT
jgi:hypothetical protein